MFAKIHVFSTFDCFRVFFWFSSFSWKTNACLIIDYFCAFVEYLGFFKKIHFSLFFKFSVISSCFLIIPKFLFLSIWGGISLPSVPGSRRFKGMRFDASPVQIGSWKNRIGENGPCEICSGQIAVNEGRPGEIRSAEVRLAKFCLCQIGMGNIVTKRLTVLIQTDESLPQKTRNNWKTRLGVRNRFAWETLFALVRFRVSSGKHSWIPEAHRV